MNFHQIDMDLSEIIVFCVLPFISDQKAKFSISDEAIDGRPLYLDAQATTPLVSRKCYAEMNKSIEA